VAKAALAAQLKFGKSLLANVNKCKQDEMAAAT
jgi:hypothetical protein